MKMRSSLATANSGIGGKAPRTLGFFSSGGGSAVGAFSGSIGSGA